VITTAIETSAGGRPLLLLRPDISQPGRCGIDLVAAATRAREIGGAVCLLVDGQPLPVLLQDVPLIAAQGSRGAWLSVVWKAASMSRELRTWWRDRTMSVARELSRELRRHAGDERLPFELRQRLRTIADATRPAARAESNAFPRRLLRTLSPASLSPAGAEQARTQLASRGLTDERPLVTFESRTRPDIARPVVEFLRHEGYAIARIGDRCEDSRLYDGVVDLTTRGTRSLLHEMFLVSRSAFVVCESIDLQHLAYLTNTPSLVINAKDPFAAYPVRANGLFALSTSIDLEAARPIRIDDMLTEAYFRDLRKQEARGRPRGSYSYRDNSAAEVIEAIKEVRAGIAGGWTAESTGQSRFRAQVVDAGGALAAVSPHVAEWGPDEGFIGDGRLVRFQADRAS
jgi:putative glycosyltransferase (TIGR04372 family)